MAFIPTHIHTYTYIYTYIHTHTHTYIYIYTYIHTYTHTYIYIYIYIKQHTHTPSLAATPKAPGGRAGDPAGDHQGPPLEDLRQRREERDATTRPKATEPGRGSVGKP